MDLGLLLQHRNKFIEILYLGVHWNLEKKAGYLKPKEIFNTVLSSLFLPLYICVCRGGGMQVFQMIIILPLQKGIQSFLFGNIRSEGSDWSPAPLQIGSLILAV